jgi:hypothetical protein
VTVTEEDWRAVDGRLSAWFDAPTVTAGAELVRHIAETTVPDVDLRPAGVRVRVSDPQQAGPISAAARDLGLAPDPTVLQTLGLVVETADPPPVAAFWQTVLGYEAVGLEELRDPSRRDPGLSVRPSEPRPTRDRIHVDVVRASDAVAAARTAVGQEPTGAYGVALSDPDGNVVDLVPGDRIAEGAETADWLALFAAVTHYPVDTGAQAVELVSSVAARADAAGLPLLVDVRAGGVTIDSGKDLWEDETGGARRDFLHLAAGIQAAAHDLGLVADPGRPRFVQVGIDAVDVPAVRTFWAALLGYAYDPREWVSDIVDPRRLNPVVFFQAIEEPTTDRLAHRNRVRVTLSVPPDGVPARLDAAVAAGGRVVTGDRLVVLDPEGNEIDIVTS